MKTFSFFFKALKVVFTFSFMGIDFKISVSKINDLHIFSQSYKTDFYAERSEFKKLLSISDRLVIHVGFQKKLFFLCTYTSWPAGGFVWPVTLVQRVGLYIAQHPDIYKKTNDL